MLTLILKENSFRFNGKNYLQIYDTAMDTKMAVAFANIFMANIRTQILLLVKASQNPWFGNATFAMLFLCGLRRAAVFVTVLCESVLNRV